VYVADAVLAHTSRPPQRPVPQRHERLPAVLGERPRRVQLHLRDVVGRAADLVRPLTSQVHRIATTCPNSSMIGLCVPEQMSIVPAATVDRRGDEVDEVVDVDHVAARVHDGARLTGREALVERRDRPRQVPWPVDVRQPERQRRHTRLVDVLAPCDLRDRVRRDRREGGVEVEERAP
jgi:hypothetical protein